MRNWLNSLIELLQIEMNYDENDADLVLPKVSNVFLEVKDCSFKLKGTLVKRLLQKTYGEGEVRTHNLLAEKQKNQASARARTHDLVPARQTHYPLGHGH